MTEEDSSHIIASPGGAKQSDFVKSRCERSEAISSTFNSLFSLGSRKVEIASLLSVARNDHLYRDIGTKPFYFFWLEVIGMVIAREMAFFNILDVAF
jgi:hypothetical protein